MSSVFEHLYSLRPKTARKEMSAAFGAQLGAWTHEAGVRVTDLARGLGVARSAPYAVFDGSKALRAEHLYLLPPALLRVVLDDLAASIGYELRPLADDALPAGYDHARDAVAYLKELTDCVRARAEGEVDGQLSVEEIEQELGEIEEALRIILRRQAFLRAARAERGGLVVALVERFKGRRGA